MNLLIMGPPGAGKGSQAALIKEFYQIAHISTGEMFREAILHGTHVGLIAKEYIDRGELVPDSVTIDLVKERLQEDDTKNGFLLDGFPRTIPQAIALNEILAAGNKKIDKVINLVVDDATLIRRISGRRVCIKCGAIYHIEGKKPLVDGVCDVCSSKLIHRDDDKIETVTNRIKVYYEKTQPLLDFYENLNLLVNVDGLGGIEKGFQEIKKILEESK
jgi:adenylate kinase